MEVKFKKLRKDAVAPKSYNGAGFDLSCVSMEVKEGLTIYDTGIAVEIPEGYMGLVFPRSSVYKTGLNLANSVGVIDPEYRSSIKFMFRHTKEAPIMYDIGDRVGQLIIMPYPKIEFVEAEELSETERGEGGFGSTGK